MGKITKAKLEKVAQADIKIHSALVQHARHLKELGATAEVPLLNDLIPYQNYFYRDPSSLNARTKSKNRGRQLLELARYAFGKYPVCSVLTSAWTRDDQGKIKTLNGADFRLWYICVATGGSLYKEFAKPYLTKKEVHTLLNCPHSLSIEQALCYAISKGAGASDGIALKLARSKISDQPFTDFWKHAMRFFSLEPPASIAQINDLTDYLRYRHREGVVNGVSGHTLPSLLKRMDDWHRDLRRAKALGDDRWEGRDQPDQSYERKDELGHMVTWTFHQICAAKELAAEGNRMRHCVFSYKYYCVRGQLSIWSLTKTDAFGVPSPKLTIELRSDGTIAQARGLANRMPRSEEEHLLKQWSRDHNLRLSL